MKKMLSIVCVLSMLLGIWCVGGVSLVSAATQNGYTYTVSGGNATITGYTGSATSLTIPSTLGGYPVREIGWAAFENKSSIKSVSIPSSIRTIGACAFSGCTGLTSLSIANGVTTTDNYAFSECTSLKTVTLPNSITTMDHGAFSGCTSLQSVTLPNKLTWIGEDMFSDCIKLTTITLPDSVTDICCWAFIGCTALKSIVIPKGVTWVGQEAFYKCSALKDVYYKGSQTQWKAIDIDMANGYLTNATIHYNYGQTYKVTYNANGGSGAPASQTKVPGTPLTLSSQKPTRSGYTFLGWATSQTATKAAYQPGSQFKNNTNTTLYAVWQKNTTYKVTYNANGGSGAPASQTKIPGTPLTLSSQKPTRSGYTFLGWATSQTATTAAYQPGSQFKNNTNTTLYAVWQKGTTYKVTFNANGGGGAPAAQTKVPGTPLVLSWTVPTRSGYAFVGWATSKTATKAAYQPGSQFKNNTNTTLYAVWQKGVYRVEYITYSGTGAPAPQMKVPGTPLTLSSTFPTRSGYAFYGWSASPSSSTVAYQPGDPFKNNTHTKLYAVWMKNAHRVTYNANGGSGAPAAQFKIPGTPLTLSSQKPTRSGYTFLGWATSASATTAAYASGAQFKNNTQTTLYAVWQKNTTYKVTYNANGGSGAPAAQTKIPGTPLTLSSQKPTRSGYAFIGWATSASATSATYACGAKFKNNVNTTLYAVWKKAGVGTLKKAVISKGGNYSEWWSVPNQTGYITFYSTGSDDTKIYFYDPDGNQIGYDDDGGEGTNFSLTLFLEEGVRYTYRIMYYDTSKTGTIEFYSKFG